MTQAAESITAFQALGVQFDPKDVSYELARQAYMGTSFNAEARATSTVNQYMYDMQCAAKAFEEAAGRVPDRKERAADMLKDYKSGYLKRLNHYLSSKAGCVSWFIAGPSKFPTHRQQKLHASADRRAEELHQYATGRLARMVRLVTRPPRMNAQERADDLRRRIEQAEAEQARMKEANKIIRDQKLAAKLQAFGLTVTDALVSLGLSEGVALEIQRGDFVGRIGFPDYKLSNNSAEIRRLKLRLRVEQAKAEQAATCGPLTCEYDTATEGQVSYEQHPDDNRVRLSFPAKPAYATIQLLKRHGFRWSPRNNAWQRFLTGNGKEAAAQVLKMLGATKAERPPEADSTV